MLRRLPGGRHRTFNRCRLVLPVAVAALLLGPAGCGSTSHPGVPSSAARARPGLESIFEDDGHLHSDPEGTLALMRQLGVARMRVFVSWQSVAPAPTSPQPPKDFSGADPASYPASAWTTLDRIVRAAATHGIGVDLTIAGPVPRWATGAGAPVSPYTSWKPSDNAFGALVRAIGTRFSGSFKPAGASSPLPRVDFWSIWNEPNYGPSLAPQAIERSTVEVSPQLYRGLLDAAWSALGATGHGHDTILIGETAPRGITTGDNPGNFSGMVPLRFIRALYCVGGDLHPLTGSAAAARACPPGGASASFVAAHPALFGATGFADHPYPQGGMPPNATTPAEPDYADLGALPRLEQTLDRARVAYGSFPPLPIYSTEFGYQTDPPETIAHTTPTAVAALYLNWSEYLSWRDPRIHSYDQYLLSDPANANASGGFATGLWFKNGTPKPTFAAYRLPLFLPATGRSRDSAEVWGCVRPARYAGSPERSIAPAQIQFRPGPKRSFRTVARVPIRSPQGYFDTRVRLPAQGQVRLSWRPPRGPVIHSRIASLRSG